MDEFNEIDVMVLRAIASGGDRFYGISRAEITKSVGQRQEVVNNSLRKLLLEGLVETTLNRVDGEASFAAAEDAPARLKKILKQSRSSQDTLSRELSAMWKSMAQVGPNGIIPPKPASQEMQLKMDIPTEPGSDPDPRSKATSTTGGKSMGFPATVYRVLIASPGDVREERNVVEEVINDWNIYESEAHKVVLVPIRWEKSATPEMGGPAQDLINVNLVAKCDILIGVFWVRIGTPTKKAPSGTAEEIEQFISSKRPAMLYFSNRKINPDDLDSKQHKRLKKLKKQYQSSGLTGEFKSTADLRRKLQHHLTDTIRRLTKAKPSKGRHQGDVHQMMTDEEEGWGPAQFG